MTRRNSNPFLNRGQRSASQRMAATEILMASLLALMAVSTLHARPATAQDWQTGVNQGNTTTIVPSDRATKQGQTNSRTQKSIKLIAYLTDEGQRIDKGLVWHVYKFLSPDRNGALITTSRQANPTVRLKNGRYIINVSFGRAYITRELKISNATVNVEKKFVLNAGGLRVNALLEAGSTSDAKSVRYDIFTDRDQVDNRELVLAGVKPDLIIRLNAGIYHIVSTYGDANATVASDVTVEPGKLTEATVTHSAAKVRFKLVARSGGEALPDTQWSVKTTSGDIVKSSVGALPTHILAPGSYTVVGVSDGQAYEQSFTVANGQRLDVEVLKR